MLININVNSRGGKQKMSVVAELIRKEGNGTISFGNHELAEKAKKEDFEYKGNLYKVKTSEAMTKLERDGMFVYESVPGTSVNDFEATKAGVKFRVEGAEDAQIIIGLTEEVEYEVYIGGNSVGKMKANLGGKLNISVDLANGEVVEVEIIS
jgi:hypothetical protein